VSVLDNALAPIRRFRREYLAINIAYYGAVAGAMAWVSFDPALQQELLEAVGGAFTEGPLGTVAGAYAGGNVLLAAVLTFAVNLLLGSVVSITLPSLVIPFSGLLVGMYRAFLWGALLSPTSEELALIMIPHSITLVLEGQAYIVAMLAAYIQGRAIVWPATVGAGTRRQGYIAGVRSTLRLYAIVALLLAVAAVYEAIEVIYIIPPLIGAP